jgi:catechol 2,3-dioxygenase-like lactoylglutathione lyase family enzyme
MSVQSKILSRLHHTTYVSKDLEATRRFYEDLLGFPLIATSCESDELFGAVRTYCHCFFGIGDGSPLVVQIKQTTPAAHFCRPRESGGPGPQGRGVDRSGYPLSRV